MNEVIKAAPNVLNPCPRCGGEGAISIFDFGFSGTMVQYRFRVRCEKCGEALHNGVFSVIVELTKEGDLTLRKDEREKAIDAWNRR